MVQKQLLTTGKLSLVLHAFTDILGTTTAHVAISLLALMGFGKSANFKQQVTGVIAVWYI
jgi:RsiW-degrading membrane proteinase PrsW (M82 family)